MEKAGKRKKLEKEKTGKGKSWEKEENGKRKKMENKKVLTLCRGSAKIPLNGKTVPADERRKMNGG